MRVISGRAKGRRLRMVPGGTTRPMTDRAKENLFNILGDWVVGTRWLDLFAGTGQVGIEALSRGAREAVFVDSAPAAIQTIRQNLKHTNLAEGTLVRKSDAFKILETYRDEVFDVVYVAPPQYRGFWEQSMASIDKFPGIVSTLGIIIAQIDPAEYSPIELANFELYDQRKYGRTMLCFYEHTQ